MSFEAFYAKELGNAAYRRRDFATAHSYYDEAIRLLPQEITFHSNKGAAFFEEGKFDDCIGACMTAVTVGTEIKAQIAKVMAKAANAHAKLGNLSDALVWYKRSLAENPDEDVKKNISEITEMLQKAKISRDESSKLGKDSDAPVSRIRLSPIYLNEIFFPLLLCDDVSKHAERCKKVVYASPVISEAFLEFMEPFDILLLPVRISFMLDDATTCLFGRKTWDFFTWITPFIRSLSVVDPPPSYASFIFKNAGCFLNKIQYWGFEPPRDDVLSFVRRQIPHLTELRGPPAFFKQIPADLNPNFDVVSVTCSSMKDFLTVFKNKRFSAGFIALMDINHTNFTPSTLNLHEVMTFLLRTDIRMPETEQFKIELMVLDNFVPISQFLIALRSVFTQLKDIQINVLFRHELKTPFNLKQMDLTYQHCAREVAKLSDIGDMEIWFSVTEHVVYEDYAMVLKEYSRHHESPNFVRHDVWFSETFHLPMPGLAYVSREQDSDAGNGSIRFHYEVNFVHGFGYD